ncbi:TetR/AcrR family transcriptional regulator [Agaribacter marinus]|uniref:TetR family transcriptional regulator n=1 Tax=Agaribacter marinus TaxID=1431249 RepID=A0AA37WLJ2_9ALTE|nr:TetR/AcrR family transcriptional regulator [Agaribacter marinus]GLR72215.1 TetR family transcriptional regulator [Agaribacter marinus]
MATQSSTLVKPLGKQRILEAAIAYADEHGVEMLTMRKIADKLGCGVMSLYNHVANKEEMLVGMVDIVAGEIELPQVNDDWKGSLRASAANAHKVLLRHKWAPAQWSLRMPGPARIRYMDAILQVLTEAGLEPKLVYSGYHAVTMHIIGFTLQEIGYLQVLDADFDELANEFLKELSGDFPYMAEHVRAHLNEDCCGSDEFGFVLDLILEGLERIDH